MLPFILVSLSVLLAAASPVNNTGGTNATNATNAPMWMGDVPGHGHVELYGDAHAVLEQIFALSPGLRGDALYQPGYNPFMSPHPGGGAGALNMSDHTVAARGALVNHEMSADNGYTEAHFFCGTFATGDYYDSYEAIAAVHTGQNGYWTISAARSQDPPVPMCMRLACSVEDGRYANTAVYWCNDNPFPVTAPAPVLAAVAGMVASGYKSFEWSGCCQNSQQKGKYGQFSGQIFIGNGTNVNVGWGDCSVPDYFSSPSQYPYPGKYGACS